jgi:hypothetical protein
VREAIGIAAERGEVATNSGCLIQNVMKEKKKSDDEAKAIFLCS